MPGAFGAPFAKIFVARPPRGKLCGQHPPLAATFQHIQHAAEHLVSIHRAGLRALPRHFKHRQNECKLFAADVARVLLSHGHLLRGDHDIKSSR